MKWHFLNLPVVALALAFTVGAHASAVNPEGCCISARCPKVKGAVVSFVVFPKEYIISVPDPEYPAVAKAAKISGEVKVEALIGRGGRVVRARVLEGHPLLRRAAVEAACGARFKPVKLSGRAVNVLYVITYHFRLE